jgi:hypothetical protein
MKLVKIITVTAACALSYTLAQAVHVWEDPGAWSSGVMAYSTAPKYNAKELTLDLFGSYAHGESHLKHIFETDIRRNGTWGGGVGINYFFTPWLGIGGDINMGDNRGPLVDQALGSLILRAPLGNSCVAPYVFGGGGRSFGSPSWQWLGDVGVGIEFRVSPGAGIFADGRYVWAERNSGDGLLLRAGLRLAF